MGLLPIIFFIGSTTLNEDSTPPVAVSATVIESISEVQRTGSDTITRSEESITYQVPSQGNTDNLSLEAIVGLIGAINSMLLSWAMIFVNLRQKRDNG
jgi:hypothetical protein